MSYSSNGIYSFLRKYDSVPKILFEIICIDKNAEDYVWQLFVLITQVAEKFTGKLIEGNTFRTLEENFANNKPEVISRAEKDARIILYFGIEFENLTMKEMFFYKIQNI